MAGGDVHRVRTRAQLVAVSDAKPRPRAATDLEETIQAAQTALERSVQLGRLTNDPLRHPLEALSITLGAFRDIVAGASERAEATVTAALDGAVLQLDQASERANKDAHSRAERIINAAGEWAAKQIRDAAQQAGADLAAQAERARGDLVRAARGAMVAAYVSGLCALATVGSLVAFLVFR